MLVFVFEILKKLPVCYHGEGIPALQREEVCGNLYNLFMQHV